MGSRQVAQGSLFYEFSLEDHVPQGHLFRAIDRFVDLGGIRRHLARFYSNTGRPSIDPELMIRMLMIGYCFGIRPERRICEEVHLNLAYRWFCRLDLTTPVPDHAPFSKNRHGRFRESNLLREVFEMVVRRCMAEGLVGGSDFASDAGLIRADAAKMRSLPHAQWDDCQIDGEAAPRAVREYLEMLDDAAFGAATDVRPKFISFSDPASQWTAAMNGPAIFAYSVNYLIDTDNAVIIDVEACRSVCQAEVGATRTMVDRTKDTFALQPERLAADSAYGSGDMLAWLDDRQINPHIPVFDKTDRADGIFPNTDFSFNPVADEYICPGGNKLKKYWRTMSTPRSGTGADGFRRYYASKKDCGACALKAQCTPNQETRKISRHPHEAVRNKVRAMAGTDAFLESGRRRKKVEMLFAHLKPILGLGRLRLRGPNGARDEFHLAATAQNLRKLAKLVTAPQEVP